MRSLPAAMAAKLASGRGTFCWCWRVVRRDGAAFGFTDHDSMLEFDGTEFQPDAAENTGEFRFDPTLSVDATDIGGALSSDAISEADIRAGLWDGASVEIFKVDWQDVASRYLMRRGQLGEVRRGKLGFTVELRSQTACLNQEAGRTFQKPCDAFLGDERCKIDLATYTKSGIVDSVISNRQFAISGAAASETTGYFALGILTWTSGQNVGRKAYVFSNTSGVTHEIALYEVAVSEIAVGDMFEVVAGCDQTFETCKAKFKNVANHRGFPHMPGDKVLFQVAGEGRDNNSRGR